MKNLRGLEQRIMQDAKPELLDVKTKQNDNNQPTSPVSYSGKNKVHTYFLFTNLFLVHKFLYVAKIFFFY